MLCILHHRGVQLILAYSWARPAILVVGKGRGGMFLFLLFLHFHSCSSFFPVPLFHLLYSLFYLFSPFLWETTQNDPLSQSKSIRLKSISKYIYPDIRSMLGYIVFAFPFVHSFVRMYIRSYVRSFVFPSQGQSFCVKVYKTSYFEDPVMDFVHIWHDGRYRSKVFISTIPTPGVKVTDLEFS